MCALLGKTPEARPGWSAQNSLGAAEVDHYMLGARCSVLGAQNICRQPLMIIGSYSPYPVARKVAISLFRFQRRAHPSRHFAGQQFD